jgi:hypothetical protein
MHPITKNMNPLRPRQGIAGAATGGHGAAGRGQSGPAPALGHGAPEGYLGAESRRNGADGQGQIAAVGADAATGGHGAAGRGQSGPAPALGHGAPEGYLGASMGAASRRNGADGQGQIAAVGAGAATGGHGAAGRGQSAPAPALGHGAPEGSLGSSIGAASRRNDVDGRGHSAPVGSVGAASRGNGAAGRGHIAGASGQLHGFAGDGHHSVRGGIRPVLEAGAESQQRAWRRAILAAWVSPYQRRQVWILPRDLLLFDALGSATSTPKSCGWQQHCPCAAETTLYGRERGSRDTAGPATSTTGNGRVEGVVPKAAAVGGGGGAGGGRLGLGRGLRFHRLS